MKLFSFTLIILMGSLQGASLAQSGSDSVNGNLIPEPRLLDYVRAERTPGFSEITDITQ
jgi:hypothetical protein